MNRRSFFTKFGLAAASMAILPAATTYARHWVKPAADSVLLVNPAWVNAEYEISFLNGQLFNFAYEWKPILEGFREQQAIKDALNPIPQPKFSNYYAVEV